MELSQNLRRLLAEQQAQNAHLETAIQELENADFLRENAQLREQVDRYRQDAARHGETAAKLTQENNTLRERLFEQIYSQRSTLLGSARQQADILFAGEDQAAVNRLAAHNAQVRQRLQKLRAQLDTQGEGARELLDQVARLEDEARQFMREASSQLNQGFAQERADAETEYAAMEREPLTQEQLNRKLHQNSVELRIGGKITVAVGVFFILLAVIFGLRYTFIHLQSNLLKGLLAYLLGGLFLAGGEIISRKQRSPFSIGICAGGIAILFASTAASYFGLEILSMPLAIGICIAVTALALLQAMRYDAQVIAVFALLGGYMPMTAVGNSTAMLVSAMIYFLLLNLFVLLVALKKRWQPLKFFSLSCSILGTGYLLLLHPSMLMSTGILYVMASFLLYMAIVLVYPMLQRVVLRVSDTVLLGLNTAFTCGFLFLLLNRNGYESLNGAVALGFCVLFFLFARWLGSALENDAGARGLFYTTSFAFLVLTAPLQLEPHLISMGWLCEGVALCVFGTLSDRKWYRRSGQVISALCLASFVLWDLRPRFSYFSLPDALFVWQYGAITVGALVIVGVIMFRFRADSPYWHSGEGHIMQALKGCALVNAWLFAVYYITAEITLSPFQTWQWAMFVRLLMLVVVTLGIAVIYRAIPVFQDVAMRVISRILYILGFGLTLGLNTLSIPADTTGVWILVLVLLIALDAGVILALFDLLRISFPHSPRDGVALGTSLFALVLVIQLLMVQGEMSFRSMIISFVLIAWAFAAIIFGFFRRYSLLRRFGLGLSLVSITKLFLVDLYFLGSSQKILSYFVFGVIFIAISYVYQLFSKRLFPAVVAPPPPPVEEPSAIEE